MMQETMRRQLDATAVKAAVSNLGALWLLRRYTPNATGNGHKARSTCPVCKSPNPQSMNATRLDQRLVANCFVCGLKGDAVVLEMSVKNVGFREALEALARDIGHAGCASPSPSLLAPKSPAIQFDPLLYSRVAERLIQLCHIAKQPDVKAYLQSRGLYDEAVRDRWGALPPSDTEPRKALYYTLKREFGNYDLGAETLRSSGVNLHYSGQHRLLIPWRGLDGSIVALQRRFVGTPPDGIEKIAFDKGTHAGSTLYGLDAFAPWADDQSIAIELVEGATDVLARRILLRREGQNRIVLGLSSATTQIKPEWHPWLRGREVHIATDNDEAGHVARERLLLACKQAGASRVLATPPPAHVKDWAEILEVSK
jgi:DNA primase